MKAKTLLSGSLIVQCVCVLTLMLAVAKHQESSRNYLNCASNSLGGEPMTETAPCEPLSSFLFISSPTQPFLSLLQTSALSLPGPRVGRRPTRSASPPWSGSSTSSSKSNRALKTWSQSTLTELPRYKAIACRAVHFIFIPHHENNSSYLITNDSTFVPVHDWKRGGKKKVFCCQALYQKQVEAVSEMICLTDI